MTSPEPARTPLAERLSPVPGPSGINLRPREGKNNVDVAVEGEGESKGGRGGRVKKRGQAGNPGGTGRTGQQPATRGARAKRGGSKPGVASSVALSVFPPSSVGFSVFESLPRSVHALEARGV